MSIFKARVEQEIENRQILMMRIWRYNSNLLDHFARLASIRATISSTEGMSGPNPVTSTSG